MPRNPFIDDRAEDDSADDEEEDLDDEEDVLDDEDEISLGGDEDENDGGDESGGMYAFHRVSKFLHVLNVRLHSSFYIRSSSKPREPRRRDRSPAIP